MPPLTSDTYSTTNSMTAREKECAKTQREKQADISYTASHAVMCLLTDFTPILSHLSQKHLPHADDHAHHHSNIWSHMEGEVLGDVAAVVATVAVQRLAPEMTAAIRALVEPIARPVYQASATLEANAWADHHNEIRGTDSYKAHLAAHYEREMSKLPMGIVWAVSSLMLNSGYQVGKAALSKRSDLSFNQINTGSFVEITQSNAVGALITFALTNGLRAGLPRQMRKVDSFAAKHITEPLTSFLQEITGHGTIAPMQDKELAVT